MSELAVWFERKFTFDFPVELNPNLRIRLRWCWAPDWR